MLYIKNGRLYTQSYSYIVPDELCLIPDTFETSPDTITLETLDGKFQLMIRPYDTEKTPIEELSSMLEYCGHVKMSEILDIDRGGMIGKGVFYRSDSWRYEHYEERSRYAMNDDGQNALELYIEHEVQDESERNKIKEFMEQPKVKALLESIRYEPQVCEKILNGN